MEIGHRDGHRRSPVEVRPLREQLRHCRRGHQRTTIVPVIAVPEPEFSQLTKRNPPAASNLGAPGGGRICSCSSSILFLEQSQHWSAKSPSRRVCDSSITCTIAPSVTRESFL